MARVRAYEFGHRYVENDYNGVQTVLDLGWTNNYRSAGVIAYRLLKTVAVKSIVQKHMEQAKLNADLVSQELAKIAHADTGEISEAAKMKALDLATKVLGMQVQKIETTDTSERDSLTSALLKSIESASKRDNLTRDQAAIGLFDALVETNPSIADPESWPAEYKSVILEHLAQKGQSEPEPESQAVN